MARGGVAERPKAAGLWRNRDWTLLWSGQLVSVVGTQVSQLAYPLLMLALTNSPAQAGFLSAARILPYLLLGLPAGALVDRWDRRRVMIICDAGRALALGSIPLAIAFGRLTLAQLYAVALIEGALNVFFNLAETAALTRVVSREQIPAATTLNEVTLSTGSMLGPAFGGLIFAIGQGFAFLADAVSYGVSVVSVWLIRAELSAPRTAEPNRLVDDIREGIAWLWRQSLMRFLAFVVGGTVLIESGYMLVVIILAQHMGASPATIGLISRGRRCGQPRGRATLRPRHAAADLWPDCPRRPLDLGAPAAALCHRIDSTRAGRHHCGCLWRHPHLLRRAI